MRIQRSTFLVAPDGRIAHAWPKVTAEGHAEDVRADAGRGPGRATGMNEGPHEARGRPSAGPPDAPRPRSDPRTR